MLVRDLGKFDAVIVGAGPAGSSTAIHLLARAREGGRTIAIVERHRIPREKPCGGAISRWGVELLEALGAKPDRLGVETIPIHCIRVRHGAHATEHRREEPLGVVVRRDRFDAALVREAERRGANLFEGWRLIEMRRDEGVWRLTLEGERGAETTDRATIAARIVVGADGTGSAVRRLAGFEEGAPRSRLIVLESEQVDADDVHRPEGGVIEFDLSCVDHGIDGYVWHFATPLEGPNGSWMVSRGIYDWRGRRQGDAVALRETLASLLEARGVDPKRVKYKPYTERVFAQSNGPLSRRDGVLLAGEAARLVDPVTGEGIAQALACGEVAARAVDDAWHEGSIDPIAYAEAVAALHCHGHLRQALSLAPHVYGPRGTLWCAALAASPDAVAAGADWYVGAPLGLGRKLAVGASMAWRAVRAAWL
jgi:geranylgeranyl reductase family protein